MKKKTLLILLASACAIGLSACEKKTDGVASGSATASSAKPGDLVVDLGGDAPTLDPAMVEDTQGSRVVYDLFDGLVTFDQHNNPILSMAKSYTVSKDGKVYTFVLRDGLKFSDGTPITAADFVYSWQRGASNQLGSPYAYLMDNVVNGKAITTGKVDKSKLGVKAVDPMTLQVTLIDDDSDFLKKLTMPIFDVVSQKNIEKFKDAWLTPGNLVSSGAYTLKERVINGYITVVKNPNYYDESDVTVNTIKFTVNDDTNANYLRYQAGGIDVLYSLPVDQRASAKAANPKEYHETTWETISYYDLNETLPEFKNNPKLRQALSMAVDRKVLADNILGAATALYAPVSLTIDDGKYADLSYDWESWPRDKQIAEAQRLYKEAGYSAAKPFNAQISFNTLDKHRKVALAVSSMWKDTLGVNTTISNMEWKTFLQARHTGNYQIARDGWVADYSSAFMYTPLYLCGNPQNNSKYCNPKYDALVARALVAPDTATQVDLLHQAFKVVMNDYPIIPLFQDNYYRLINQKISGYDMEHNYLDHVQSKWYHVN